MNPLKVNIWTCLGQDYVKWTQQLKKKLSIEQNLDNVCELCTFLVSKTIKTISIQLNLLISHAVKVEEWLFLKIHENLT